jgi:hypothetical protein
MVRRTSIITLFIFVFISFVSPQTTKVNKAELLQSFKTRGILMDDFVQTCKDNGISLLMVHEKMGNRSKMTRFTTYKASLIYVSKTGRKRLTYLYGFKDDTLMTIKSY